MCVLTYILKSGKQPFPQPPHFQKYLSEIFSIVFPVLLGQSLPYKEFHGFESSPYRKFFPLFCLLAFCLILVHYVFKDREGFMGQKAQSSWEE